MPRYSKRRRGGSGLKRPSMRAAHPPYDYMYQAIRRDPTTLEKYGNTKFAPINPAQAKARIDDRIYGQGQYMGGRGGFSSMARKGLQLYKRNATLVHAGMNYVIPNSGTALGLMTGRGEYVTNSVIPGGSFDQSIPTFGGVEADELGAITITHKEYLTDIYGNGAATPFVNTTWSINPGLERTFPWLAQLAANFDEYELKQLIFSYRSTVSNDVSSSNGQVGTIIMVADYNTGDSSFVEKGTMMQYAGAVSAKTADDLQCGIECDPAKLSGDVGKYVRSSPVLIGQDIKTYDLANFQLAVSGTPTAYANQPIGELWVSYSIMLRKPKLFTGAGNAVSKDIFCGSTGCTALLPFGSNILTGQQNQIGALFAATGPSTYVITLPAYFTGFLEVQFRMVGTVIVPATASSVTGNVQVVSDLPTNGGSAGAYLTLSATGTEIIYHFKSATNYGGLTNNTISLNFVGQTAASVAFACLTITEYNPMSNPLKVPVLLNSIGAISSL